MDIMHPQVHGEGKAIDLPPSVRLFTGDVTHAPDCDAVLRLFQPSQIVHLAAETGTAQSLSEATRHGCGERGGNHSASGWLESRRAGAGPARPGVVPEPSTAKALGSTALSSSIHRRAATPSSWPASGTRKSRRVKLLSRVRVAPHERFPGRPTSTPRPNSPKSTSWLPGRPLTTPSSACCACKMSTGQVNR